MTDAEIKAKAQIVAAQVSNAHRQYAYPDASVEHIVLRALTEVRDATLADIPIHDETLSNVDRALEELRG